MSIDEEITRDTGGDSSATAVGDRPERPARAARGVSAPPRPGTRRAAPPRPVRRSAAARPAAPASAESPRRASPSRGAPRTPFVLLVVGLLCGGLVSLLLLNTVLAQDSFKMNDLRNSTQELHQQAQDINTEVMIKSQPGEIAKRARQLGGKADNQAPDYLVIPPKDQGTGRPAGTTGSQGAQAEVPTR
jgi:hypothetical protein